MKSIRRLNRYNIHTCIATPCSTSSALHYLHTQVVDLKMDTAEYQTFFRNQAEIADTIGDINGLIDRIVADLYAKKIVGKSIRDAADIRGPHVTEILRVRPVLKAILARIELDSHMYYKMRDVLLSDSITADAPGLRRYLPEGIYWFTLMHAHILLSHF